MSNANGVRHKNGANQKLVRQIVAFMPNLKAFAMKLCKDQDLAEDLVQHTLLQAIEHLNQFVPGTNLEAWLFTILKNLLSSRWRKHRREATWETHLEDSALFCTGLWNSQSEDVSEFKKALACLCCLPTDQCDALIAVGYLGMSYDEASERLNCAVGTIKSRVNRARAELLDLLESGKIVRVDTSRLKSATRSIPRSHPYYPIAEAYESLYSATEDIPGDQNGAAQESASDFDKAWETLVASGVLDEERDPFEEIFQPKS